MIFSNNIFIMLFLPIIFAGAIITRKRTDIQNIFIVFLNVAFCIWNGYLGLVVLIFCISILYIFSIFLYYEQNRKKRKCITLFAFLSIFFVFIYFKYMNKFMPIGISFYSFEAFSYLLDQYYGREDEKPSFKKIIMYLSFFATIMSGPITRYHDISTSITKREITLEQYELSIKRFIVGYAKKSLIADKLSPFAGYYFSHATDGTKISMLGFWMGAIAYSLVLYYNFSGYSDMAIALAGFFGFHLPENFKSPYLASSVTDFWRRWHVSLSMWFRDYVYIPLGGNRVGVFRNILNICIVWCLTGLWHGMRWTFFIWAAGHCILLLNEKFNPYMKRILKNRIIAHIYTLFCINFLWIFFNASDVTVAFSIISGMFRYSSKSIEPFAVHYFLFLFIGIVCCLPWNKISTKYIKENRWQSIFLGIIFILSVAANINGSYTPFIYGKF